MAANNAQNTGGLQEKMNLPGILDREANRIVQDSYSKLHAEGTAIGGVEGQRHLNRGYQAAIHQGYEVIDERNTEVANTTETIGEPRSVKRNKMKQIYSDEKSSPSGPGIGAPSLRFGAALSNVPAPIWTNHKPLVSDQLSKEGEMGDPTLPLINEHLARLSAPLVPRASIGFGIDLQRAQSPSHNDIDPSDTDPYKDKAEQIGLSHGFAGKGFLDNDLTPLGWREGDPPIKHTEARQLFDYSRDKQREILLRDCERTSHIDTPEQHALNQQRDDAWIEAYNFDKFILRKRKEIYNVYLQRKVEREYEQQVKKDNAALYPSLSARHVQAGESSETILSRLYKSTLGKARNRRIELVCIRDCAVAHQNKLDADSPPDIIDILRLPSGIPSFISPGVLDPRLVLSSFQACYAQYTANKGKISRWNDANEYLMTSFNSVYGEVLRDASRQASTETQDPSCGSIRLPSFDVPEPPAFGTGEPQTYRSGSVLDVNGRPLASPLPIFPLPGVSNLGLPTDRKSLTVPRLHQSRPSSLVDEQSERRSSLPISRGQSVESYRGSVYPPPALVSYNGESREASVRRSIGIESRPVTPQPKKGRGTLAFKHTSNSASKKATPVAAKRALKPQPAKSQTWYHNHFDPSTANLPRTVRSKESMERMLEEATTELEERKAATSKKSTPKRRRKKSPIDMSKGFVVSTAVAQALNKAGVPWVPNPAQASSQTVVSTTGSAAQEAGGTTALTGSSVRPDGAPRVLPPRLTGPHAPRFPTNVNEASRTSTVSSANPSVSNNSTSEFSSHEDPTDATYQPGEKRKAVPATPRTLAKKRGKKDA